MFFKLVRHFNYHSLFFSNSTYCGDAWLTQPVVPYDSRESGPGRVEEQTTATCQNYMIKVARDFSDFC